MSQQDFGRSSLSHDPDPYLQWDAAYVLGALSSAERREYEQHLSGCGACQRAVSGLAGMPGLLAQVAPEDAATLSRDAERLEIGPPPDLRPALLNRVRDRRRRVLVGIGSIAAALVLALGGLGILVSRGLIGNPPPYRVAFSPVAPSGITAVADVTPGPAETTIRLECQYAREGGTAPDGSYSELAIWVRDRAGQERELYSWDPKPDKVMRPIAEAPVATWRLSTLEIRDAHTGQILLTAPAH
ncbi:MAG TPA: zf-HC2 domain-containing protein [Microlunatus sp.]|nr:zf-HC2 domain-containing protein [Microlunatus sp.]